MKITTRAKRVTAGCLLAAALAAVPALKLLAAPVAPPPPPVAPPPPVDAAPPQTVEGTVDGFNRDPRGRVNSVVVKGADGKLDQFNLPPDLGDVAVRIAADGQRVTAVGSPERMVGDRTLFRLTKLTGADGKATLTTPTPGVPEPTETVEGTVHQLNFSPRGEVDGAVLDNGDFIHTGPEAATGLSVGAKLSAVGVAHPTPDGHRAVEATTVNGRAVPMPPPPGPGPHPGPGAVPPPRPPAPNAAPPAAP
jgi:hypothetical protein